MRALERDLLPPVMSDESAMPVAPKQLDLQGLSDDDIHLLRAFIRLFTAPGELAEAQEELERALSEWRERKPGRELDGLDSLVAEAVAHARREASARPVDEVQDGTP